MSAEQSQTGLSRLVGVGVGVAEPTGVAVGDGVGVMVGVLVGIGVKGVPDIAIEEAIWLVAGILEA